MKHIFEVENLTCAGCANKIENEIKNQEGVQNAIVDLMGKKLVVETSQDKHTIAHTIKDIFKKIEPDAGIVFEDKEHGHDGHDHSHSHDHSMSKNKVIQIALAIVLFVIAMFYKSNETISMILFIISYIIVGFEVLVAALKNLKNKQVLDENFLMAIATIGAFVIGEYAEAVAVMLFYQVGEYFQSYALNRSRKSITELMNIRPDYANLKTENGLEKVDPSQVKIDQLIVVKPGELIPLDGIVMEGESLIDTSSLTGESVLRNAEKGSEIFSGCINTSGVITVRVTKDFAESSVSKILDLVENATVNKAKTETFMNKFATIYTPIVVVLALVIAFVLPWFNGMLYSYDFIYRALVFLVLSCPCALVISIPLSYFGGIGGSSKMGILVKGSNYLEALSSVDTVVFDKTGTLTKGSFDVTNINAVSGNSDELLEIAAYAEHYSNHPIAKSIVKAYGKTIDESKISQYEEIAAHGVKLVYNDSVSVYAGNAKLMKKFNIDYDQSDFYQTVIHVAKNDVYLGYILISDAIKEDAKKAITGLKSIGIHKTVMLTGDHHKIADAIGSELGLDEIHSELLPQDKVSIMESLLQQTPGKLVFVGDGMNDAPVLARSDIGIAMGGLGSDAAIEAADIVIMNDEPSKIITAIQIAKKTKKIVKQNIALALVVKFGVLLLGVGGIATMWEAVFADVGVSLLAILNAIRMLNVKEFRK